jgi:chloramphenicol-sensitive protein RarD
LNQINNKKEYKQGVAFAILCAVLWGFLPIYWKTLVPIDPLLILFYRIVLAFGFSLILALYFYKWEGIIKPLKEKGTILTFFIAGILISFNWGIFIWAVSNDQVIQTCIGYYIEPLFVCIFGIFLFKEKLNKYKLTAFLLACSGVIVILIYYHEVPVIALALAVSFASYAAIKKKYKLDAVLALLYETMFLVPFALAAIIYFELAGRGAAANAEPFQWGMLALAGILTGAPLMLFAMAANRISMITLGITGYISPSITLMLGIFVFREPFDKIQLITFGIIWIGLVIFTLGEIKESREKEDEQA